MPRARPLRRPSGRPRADEVPRPVRSEGVISVVHTHPGKDFHPSYQDSREAIRIGLPIVVVTPIALSVAWPDGTTSYVLDSGWSRAR